jgi:hypothetical protein
MTKTTTYTVRMIMGNDKCTTQTTVESDTPENAAREAEMKWTGITVRIVTVEGPDGCDVELCEDDDHWCTTDERHGHLESDGTCMNCHY